MNYARVLSITLLAIGLSLPIEAATATWDRNPEPTVVGYRLSYGTQSGVHPTSINVGNVVTYQFFPPPGQRYYVVVQAIDSSGALSAKSDEVIYDAPATQNQPPVLTQPANQTNTQNASASLTLAASDPEGSAITFGASGLPPGLTINALTGVIAGTVSTAGTYSVTATASDGSLTASRTFTWTVTASGGGSTTVTLSPIDTTLNLDTINHSTDAKLYTYTWPANRVANAILMKFNLSQIPANATIQSATLRLSLIEMDGNTTDPNYSVSLHQVLNRDPDLTRATGLTSNGTVSWTANTCCYQNYPLAQADISPARATTVINRTLGTKTWDAGSLVQAWRSAPATNYGLLLNSDATKGSDRYRFFASMEHATVAQRPSLQIVYTVSGTPGDTTPPVVSMTAPANNATVSGSSVNVSATASDAVGVVGVQFRLNGANLGAEDTTSPYSVAWNATTATSGSHVLTAVARDAAGNSATASITVTVAGTPADTTPPAVSITAPAHNAAVSGSSVAVSATASDAVGVVGVQFRLDGANLGAEDTSSPYSVVWNATTASSGNHVLTAVARDAAGNSTTSTPITVSVNNNRAPTLTQPANQTSAEGSAVTLSLVASDPDGNALTFSATGLPAGLGISTSSGLISGTPTYTSAGTFSITATVSDGSLSASRTFSWTVTNTNRPPVLTQPANQSSSPNTTVSLQLVASDPDGTAVTYQASGLPPLAAVNSSTGLISGQLTASSAGVHTVTVTVSDGALVDTKTFTWSVDGVDKPVAGDFDGDGRDDPATYRAATGEWRRWLSASNYAAATPVVWGVSTDIPVPGDYDGDNRTDIAVYRPSTGTWHVLLSSTNNQSGLEVRWGNANDRPMALDYDNDGRADLALPRFGGMDILLSSTNYTTSVTVR